MLRRVDLPIVGRCPVDAGLSPDDRGRAWCEHCSKPVHVLSRMREAEVRALMEKHAGGTFCAEYRLRADDTIALLPEPARPLLATALAGLAACSTPASTVVPEDAVAVRDEGCPLPTPPAAAAVASAEPTERVVQVNFRIDEGQRILRGVIVGIDDHHQPDRSDRLAWIPTKTLWKQFVERVRGRRAARVRA